MREKRKIREAAVFRNYTGYKIRQRRQQLGLSIENVAAHIGVSEEAFNKIENGEFDIAGSDLYLLAQVLNTDIKYFISDLDFLLGMLKRYSAV